MRKPAGEPTRDLGVQMEENAQIVIPTLSRAKISRNLSYPIGAKEISLGLASTAQLLELNLHFHSQFNFGLRKGHFEFLRIEYLSNAKAAEERPITSLYGRPPQGRWEIVVHPVHRVVRNRIKRYSLDAALPQIRQWLGKRAELAQRGNDIL